MVLNSFHFSHIDGVLLLIFIIILIHEFYGHVHCFLVLIILEAGILLFYNLVGLKFRPNVSQMNLILLFLVRDL